MNSAIWLMVVVMLVLLFLKAPVYVAILGGSLTYFLLTPGINPIIFAQRAVLGAESISLLAIPFFVLGGCLMNYSGVTKRLMDFCEVATGRMNGGLAQVNVLLSTVMGGLSGSNLADAAMEAKLLVPEMERKGYSKAFSSSITAVSAMITPLIPPGIAMIMYGCLANVSIGKLFVSGIGIGLLLCVSLMFVVSIISKKRGYRPIRTEPLTRQQTWSMLRPAILPLCIPVIIIGSIRIGIVTATEAGAVLIVFAILLGLLYRELNLKNFTSGLFESVASTSGIMLIVAAASSFSWILTREQIPQTLTNWIMQNISNKWVFLLIVDLLLLILGMFMEGNATMIILVPLLAPIAAAFGINEIHFAMIYIFNGALGALSPPLGTLMFVTCSITKCKTKDFIRESVPFYILLVILQLAITFIPALSTGLVNLIY